MWVYEILKLKSILNHVESTRKILYFLLSKFAGNWGWVSDRHLTLKNHFIYIYKIERVFICVPVFPLSRLYLF